MFSFHATKVFNTIEGGAIAFHDKQYGELLHELKNFGIHGPEDTIAVGENAKLDEFRATMGICNLKRMDVCIAARKKVYKRYMKRLDSAERLRMPKQQEDVTADYAYFPIYIDPVRFGKTRDIVFDELSERDIHERKYFYPAINEMSCYQEAYKDQFTPIAHDVAAHILTLPMYEELGLEDVNRICDIVLG